MLNSAKINDFIVNIVCFVQTFCPRKATHINKTEYIYSKFLMEKARCYLNNYFLLARQSFDFSLENQNILMKIVLPRDQKHFPLVCKFLFSKYKERPLYGL